jgi:3-mercaptopyruvate sulfurtransferase SseA
VRALQKLGYSNVKDYKGGKAEWLEQGLPIEESPPASLWERLVEWLR